MRWRICSSSDVEELAHLNRALQEDEGSEPMSVGAIAERLGRWMQSEYSAVIFVADGAPVAYALFRPTDPDTEGLDPGIFIRQFFVVRDKRRQGIGRQAFSILREQLWPPGCGLMLDTKYDNRRAQEFWRSVGFTEYQISYVRRPSA